VHLARTYRKLELTRLTVLVADKHARDNDHWRRRKLVLAPRTVLVRWDSGVLYSARSGLRRSPSPPNPLSPARGGFDLLSLSQSARSEASSKLGERSVRDEHDERGLGVRTNAYSMSHS
jgi:hypothetical protein